MRSNVGIRVVSEGGLERPDRWYIPESGIHHQPKGRPGRHPAGE